MITFKAAPLHEANGKEVCRKQSLLHLMEVNYEKFKEKCRKYIKYEHFKNNFVLKQQQYYE